MKAKITGVTERKEKDKLEFGSRVEKETTEREHRVIDKKIWDERYTLNKERWILRA